MTEGHCKPNMESSYKNIVTAPGDSDPQVSAVGSEQAGSRRSSSNDCRDAGVASQASVIFPTTSAETLSDSAILLRKCLVTQDSSYKLLIQKATALETWSVKARSPDVKLAIEEVLNVIGALKESRDDVHKAFNKLSQRIKSTARGDGKSVATQTTRKCCDSESQTTVQKSQQDVPTDALSGATPVTRDAATDTPCWWEAPSSRQTLPRAATAVREKRQQSRQPEQQPKQQRNEAMWTEVVKKGKPREKTKQKQHPRPEAVIVQAEGLSYSDMLKKIKADKEVQAVSANFSTVSMTKAGHLRVVLNKATGNGEKISRTLQRAVGENAKSVTLKDKTTVQISDVDEEATNEDILTAITERAGIIEEVNITSKRKVGRGVQLIYATIPTSAVHKVIPRLRIGYTNCKVRQIINVKKCFKCQGFGHTRANCTGKEVTDQCWRCGETGHKSRACERNPKCFLCVREATNDHMMGTRRCHAYKRALDAAKAK